MKHILITDSAVAIGTIFMLRLLENMEPMKIEGMDNLNNYYDSLLNEFQK